MIQPAYGLRHRPVFAPPGQQLGVAAPFDDPALLHHQDLVGVPDGRKPVGDDEAGPVAAKFDHRVLDQQLGSGVHRAGRFVEDQQLRAGQERPGDGDQLLFACADVAAVVAHPGLVSVGQRVHEPVDVRGPCRLDDFVLVGIGPAVADVVEDRAAEQPGVLEHHADPGPQRLPADGRDVDAVDQDPARVDVVEPHQQIDQGGLARPGRPDDRDGATGLRHQGQVLDDGGAGAVGEVDVIELDPAALPVRRGQRLRLVRRLLVGVEQIEHPLRTGNSGLQRVVHAGDLGQRLVELTHVLDECLDAAQGDLAGRHLDTADHRHRDITEVADEGGGGPNQAGEELGAEAGVVDVAVELAEPGLRVLPVTERLDQGEAAVGLLDVGVEPSGVGPLRDEQPLRAARDLPGDEQRQRQRDDGEQRQQRRDRQHHHQHGDHGQQRREQLTDRHRQRRRDVVDVVGDPAEHLPALPGVEVRQRQPVQLVLDV